MTTAEESKKIISKHLPKEHSEILNFKNHRKHDLLPNTFRFTVEIMSLDFLISLMEDEKIRNVYYNPSAPPPGMSMDGISLRYKVYVQYY